MHGSIISLIGLQLGNVLQQIHAFKIIHADLKPDNILICKPLPEEMAAEKCIDFPLVRLIDFGRAIDMNHFAGKTFTGKAQTECFDCFEMEVG
jgi:serine/threonine protein kinase